MGYPKQIIETLGWGGGGEGGGMAQYIFTIRKQHTLNKGTRLQGNGSEHFRGVVFSYSFSIYCAAYHGIWCSVGSISLAIDMLTC